MKKRWFLIGVIFLLLPWLVVGCGVAQEQYDAVVAQLDNAQQELQSVKTELETMQTKVSELSSSLERAESELKVTQDKNSELTSNLGKSQAELETTQDTVSELTSSLEKTQNELKTANSEYQTFQSNVKTTWNRLDKMVGLMWNIIAYWSAAAKGDANLIEQRHVKMVTFVDKVGDSSCTSLWQQAMSAAETGQDDLYRESFAALMDRSMFIANNLAKEMRSRLAD
ncbi:TIGR04197 family type VII secretion effector [Chloroflexota bacterium]